jgi:ubiquinone/menaquinone biosynthesis C-methylase UbiE
MPAPYDSYNYPQYWEGREYEDSAEKLALKRLFEAIPSKKSIVDIGSGFGRLTEVYAPAFKNCLLIDPSEKLIKIGQKRLAKFKNVEFKKGKVQNLPF